MKEKIDIVRYYGAKSCKEDPEKWLDFKTHVEDTEGIIHRLYICWIPDHIKTIICRDMFPTYDYKDAIELLDSYIRFLALIHDWGKLTTAFQLRISRKINGLKDSLYKIGVDVRGLTEEEDSPHSLASRVIALYKKINPETADIVGCHHGICEHIEIDGDTGNLINMSLHEANYFGYECKSKQVIEQTWQQWLIYVLNKCGYKSVEDVPTPPFKYLFLFEGLLIMADWIASNTTYFPLISRDETITDEKEEKRIQNAWEKLGFSKPWKPQQVEDTRAFFERRFHFTANALQLSLMNTIKSECSPGLYLVEAPMGTGKTEAALAATELLANKFGYGGFLFCLPTQATANGMFDRLLSWAKNMDQAHSIRLAHGQAELNDHYQELYHGVATDSEDEPIFVHEWFEGRKQALLADFCVATIDQLLHIALKEKHVLLRLLGLAGKVVIIDECHAYDEYMKVYLDSALRWLATYNVSVILLSATLPAERKKELLKTYYEAIPNKHSSTKISIQEKRSYPCISVVNENGLNEIDITDNSTEDRDILVGNINEDEVISRLQKKLASGGCAGLIVNEVKYAQRFAIELAKALPDMTIICVHSHFVAPERMAIENRIIEMIGKESTPEKRDHVIVVGTQVLEQSLDIDFDYLITELCPMDLLLQRVGRLWRHKRVRPVGISQPEVDVLHFDEEGSIYRQWLLYRTMKYLPEKICIPEDIPELVSKAYAKADEVESQMSIFEEYEKGIVDKKNNAKNHYINTKKLKNSRKNMLEDLLDKSGMINDKQARTAVRDIDETLEVLVLKRKNVDQYSNLAETKTFDMAQKLSEDDGKQLARERLRLPKRFADYYFKSKSDSQSSLIEVPEIWKENKWIKGEILLLLDEAGECVLFNEKLQYSNQYGLLIQKI